MAARLAPAEGSCHVAHQQQVVQRQRGRPTEGPSVARRGGSLAQMAAAFAARGGPIVVVPGAPAVSACPGSGRNLLSSLILIVVRLSCINAHQS